MGALRHRLHWTDDGALHDGPRRYLMMRTDVMMGTLLRLPAAMQGALLQAWAASTCEHGAASLRAYAQMGGGNAAALIEATVQAAADLGWGRWAITPAASPGQLQLQVLDSPFVHGWRAAQDTTATASAPAQTPPAICAPINGMFSALAGMLLQGPVQVLESCACTGPATAPSVCNFVARLAASTSTAPGTP